MSVFVQTKRLISQNFAGYFIELSNYLLFPFKNKSFRVESAKNQFVIFCHGRSGSTLLLNLLNSHPDIGCDGEILSRKVFFPSLLIKCRSLISSRKVYGFKLLSYQLRDVQKIKDPEKFMKDLHRKGYKFIFLRRSNMVRLVLSVMYAEFRNEWHHTMEGGKVKHKKMHVDIKEMLKRLGESEVIYQFESAIMKDIPHIPVNYEEDLENDNAHAFTVQKIAKFLGISYTLPSASNLVKITPKELDDFIENAEEVKAALNGTSFKKYLHLTVPKINKVEHEYEHEYEHEIKSSV